MDAKDRIAAVEARRTERKAALDAAREEQRATDMEALDALEQEYGDGSVARLDVDRYVSGQPTFVVLKCPGADQYKRFCDMVARAGNAAKKLDAQNLLAESCWCYPREEAKRKEMLAAYPGLLLSIAVRAMKLVEATEEAEGKG